MKQRNVRTSQKMMMMFFKALKTNNLRLFPFCKVREKLKLNVDNLFKTLKVRIFE